MALLAELIADHGVGGLAAQGVPTGLKELDVLTRGLLPGSLWVVLGTPAVGRTVMACQVAASAAAAGEETVLLLGREPATTALANIIAAHGRIPEHHLRTGAVQPRDLPRLASTQQALTAWPLRVLTPEDDIWQFSSSTAKAGVDPWLDPAVDLPGRIAPILVIDDLDALTDRPVLQALSRLRAWARTSGQAILVTLAEEGLLDGGGAAIPGLRRNADVVLRLRRPDLYDTNDPRVGEADLEVLRHRHGPVATVLLAFQGHYRRFVDLPA